MFIAPFSIPFFRSWNISFPEYPAVLNNGEYSFIVSMKSSDEFNPFLYPAASKSIASLLDKPKFFISFPTATVFSFTSVPVLSEIIASCPATFERSVSFRSDMFCFTAMIASAASFASSTTPCSKTSCAAFPYSCVFCFDTSRFAAIFCWALCISFADSTALDPTSLIFSPTALKFSAAVMIV